MRSNPLAVTMAAVAIAGCYTPYSSAWHKTPSPTPVRTRGEAVLDNVLMIALGGVTELAGYATVKDLEERDPNPHCCSAELWGASILLVTGGFFAGGGLIGLLEDAFELEPVNGKR